MRAPVVVCVRPLTEQNFWSSKSDPNQWQNSSRVFKSSLSALLLRSGTRDSESYTRVSAMYLHVIREEELFVQDSDVSMRSARCIFTRRSKLEQFRLAAGRWASRKENRR